MFKLKYKNRFFLFFIFLSAAVITSCSNEVINTLPYVTSKEELNQRYQDAIDDAAVAEPWEICRNLTSIVDYDSVAGLGNLIWKGAKGDRWVLVCSFISSSRSNTYKNSIGKIDTAKWGEVWVTAVPELKDFFRMHFRGGDTALRAEQLLGLPPGSGKSVFVEMWVRPSDLFRPSADPEITDNMADLYFNQNASAEYRVWFNNNIAASYVHPNGYPWTRLGYTYDWGNSSGVIGLSEFVLKKGSPYEVKALYTTAEYCKK